MVLFAKQLGLVVLTSVLLLSVASAGVLFDFEGIPDGNITTAVSPEGDVMTVSTGGSTKNYFSAMTDPTDATNRCGYFRNWSGDNDLSVSIDLTASVAGPVTIQYDCLILSPSSTNNRITFYGNADAGQRFLYTTVESSMSTTTSRIINYDSSYASTASGQVMSNGQWYTVKMELPDLSETTGSFTYSLAVYDAGGSEVYRDDLSAGHGDAGNLDNFRFTTVSNYTEYYLDNMSVTVPEPMSFMLLSAGGVLGLLKKNRK